MKQKLTPQEKEFQKAVKKQEKEFQKAAKKLQKSCRKSIKTIQKFKNAMEAVKEETKC